jgi:hypothetical protein
MFLENRARPVRMVLKISQPYKPPRLVTGITLILPGLIKHIFLLNNIEEYSPYLTGNILRLRYIPTG